MRLSHAFFQTYRDDPSGAQSASHRLLLKAGFIRPMAAGIYSYLPLAVRSMHRIMTIIREEMDGIGGQEILMPVLQPAELWEESGRYATVGPELFRLTDRNRRPMVLAMTHEEAVTDLARRELSSHRQLPFMVYQIQLKLRDEPRPRAGLLRVREFHMKDAYSFHMDTCCLDRYYELVRAAYMRIFQRCGLDPVAVEADTGMMGGSGSHEFMALGEAGEDTVVRCSECGYAANLETAVSGVPEYSRDPVQPAVEKVATPGTETIEEVAAFLNVSRCKTMKAVFYNGDGNLVFAAVRGDRGVNETKLANHLRVSELTMADPDLLARHGMVPGYASPLNLPDSVTVVADRSLEWGNNYVAGANEHGYHLKNVNLGRDLQQDSFVDIGLAAAGDPCPRCAAGRLTHSTGLELGHTFKLGTKYSDAMQVNVLDEEGLRRTVTMGCYGIGVGRLLSAVAERHRDEYGLVWPVTVAPYHVHLVTLGRDGETARLKADELYGALLAAGIQTLYDDRNESPGVKFNDADLLGCPLRITVSGRSLNNGGFEVKTRRSGTVNIIPELHAPGMIQALLNSLDI